MPPPGVPQPNDPTSPRWRNFAGNLSYDPPASDGGYYFMPTGVEALRQILALAVSRNRKVRVTGQRHAQPPLVVSGAPTPADLFLIDMSCYADLGDGTQRMVIHGNSVTVNTGVREDELDAFLARGQLMLRTVTAGGFFSIGGMTAVDVHGATIEAPIFAETASAFTIMAADGSVRTITAQTPGVDGWSALQFARVSLGALGVVTSVTLEVLPRPHANTLVGGVTKRDWSSEEEFTDQLGRMLSSTTRLEAFFNPYARGWLTNPFQLCWWNVDVGSGRVAEPLPTPTACQRARTGHHGAPVLPSLEEWLAEDGVLLAQELPWDSLAAFLTWRAMTTIEQQVTQSSRRGSDLWLTWAARVMFMSYFIELPDLGKAGLGMVWNSLQSVRSQVLAHDKFHVAMPLEFRFVRGGNTAMAGTYSDRPRGSYFVNFDLIAVAPEQGAGLRYSDKLKRLFSSVEREWVALGGWPHQGKMYGFYDPGAPVGSYSDPFNPAFVASVQKRRHDRTMAFNSYRRACDPAGLFCTEYVRQLVGDATP